MNITILLISVFINYTVICTQTQCIAYEKHEKFSNRSQHTCETTPRSQNTQIRAHRCHTNNYNLTYPRTGLINYFHVVTQVVTRAIRRGIYMHTVRRECTSTASKRRTREYTRIL